MKSAGSVNLNENAIRILKDRYSLRKTSLYKYRNCYRNQVQIYSQSGRPSAMDSTSLEDLTDFCRTRSPSKDHFKYILKQAYIHTVSRRRLGINADEIAPLSRRSIDRYCEKLYIGDDT